MTNCISPSPSSDYQSLLWHQSAACKGVRFATRRISLAGRIELTKQIRELTCRNEYLAGGDRADQLESALGELLSRSVYIQWGLAEIQGLSIDGASATPESLIDKGPESLCNEALNAILSDLHLSEAETKNF